MVDSLSVSETLLFFDPNDHELHLILLCVDSEILLIFSQEWSKGSRVISGSTQRLLLAQNSITSGIEARAPACKGCSPFL